MRRLVIPRKRSFQDSFAAQFNWKLWMVSDFYFFRVDIFIFNSTMSKKFVAEFEHISLSRGLISNKIKCPHHSCATSSKNDLLYLRAAWCSRLLAACRPCSPWNWKFKNIEIENGELNLKIIVHLPPASLLLLILPQDRGSSLMALLLLLTPVVALPAPNLLVIQAGSVLVSRFWFRFLWVVRHRSGSRLVQLSLHLGSLEKLELFPGNFFSKSVSFF